MMHCFCKKIKTHHCKVVLLDEQELIKEIQDNTRGQEILDIVFSHLNLIETAYFGLRYLDASNQTHWLDPAKKIVKQLKGTDPFSLYFGVKFYAADPCKLLEEITRYQFFLQVKQDILQGRLPISFDVAAELGAYVVQSELGDYDPRRHSIGYVSEFRFVSNQTVDLEARIEELHKGLIGQLPAQAELSYLDKVKWLEMYGVDLHPVLGEDNVEYFLGLTPSGIIVLRNKNKVGHYYWPRISKIYFKGRYFMVRICDKNNEENTYGFETPSKPACKHLWKCCVEHHAFFRLLQVSPATPDIFTLGSRFRYSGRTEKQAQADAQMRLRSPPHFSRTPSRRYQRRNIDGAAEVSKLEEYTNRENIPPQELKTVSIPQPVNSISGLYRSTCSIPAALPSHNRSESPRSTRSAPWTQPGHIRGLYNSKTSPRSVRSADHTTQLLHKLTTRSSSVDSQSSNDSRSCKRHRRHRSRRGSDNESELSKCSSRSHHRHRRRSHGKRDSESEKDHHHHHRHRHKSGGSSRRRHSSNYELVDSEAQWKEVQRRQAEGGTGVHQATVINNKDNRRSGYMNSGMETESEMSYHHKRKQKKHRSRSRSPSDGGKARLPDELKKHLEFKLIDTDGMSESQLREIPYTVVETNTITKGHRKHSPSSKRKHVSRKSKSSSKDESSKNGTITESPPPPYTPTRDDNQTNDLSQNNKNSIIHISSGDSGHFSNTGPGSNSSSTSNSALGEFLNKNPPNSNHGGSGSSTHSPSGSVSTRNSNQILPRSNRSLSEFRSPSLQNISASNHFSSSLVYSPNRKHPGTNRSCANTSALYGNPTTLLGNLNDNNQILRISNPNLNKTLTTTTNNEADDSGLSFDSQEYVYSKNRRPAQANHVKTSQINKPKPVDKSSLPPLPYVQYGKQRNAYERKSDGMDSRNKQQNNAIKQVENGGPYNWNGAPDNNNSEYTRRDGTSSTRSDGTFNDKRRRGPLYYQQQPSPRVLRNSNNLNSNSCSIIDWYSDHSCIEEDEEPNDNEPDPKEEQVNLLNGNVTRSGVLHEMSTEL